MAPTAPTLPPWKTAAGLLAVTVLAYLLVIANPGFYSHDEWQKVDFIREHGFADFARAYGVVVAGTEFGTPVRPLGFLQQGLSAGWMTRAPVVPHLVDVLLHAATVLSLWATLRAARTGERVAWMTALVFALSPLAAPSTAWVAASFDRWYLLGVLLAALGMVRGLQRDGIGPLLLVAAGSTVAILSKETAMVTPAALLLVAWAQRRRGERWPGAPRVVALLACATVPIIAYLAIRWPALQATLAGGGGPYSPSPARIPGNMLQYFAFPFVPGGVEMVTLPLIARWQLVLAMLAHAGLVAALWRRAGLAWALAYLAGYFVFLLPVLPLPITGAHYLYGAGPAFALAWAALLEPRASSGTSIAGVRRAAAACAIVLVILTGRSLWIQQAVYSEGRCQSEFLTSYEPLAEAAVAGGATRLVLGAAPGTRDYVATKAMFGRTQFGPEGRWPTVRGTAARGPGEAYLEMLPDCRVARR